MADSLLAKLKSQSRLPTPPGTALEILRLCREDDVSVSQLADTLSADPALSLKLLRYANSSLFGVRKEVTHVRDAVVLLGIRAVRLMALSFSLIAQNDSRACRGFDFGRFWSHALAAAVAARYLAKLRRQVHPEEAFAAALLARIGKLVFAVGMPQEYAAVLEATGGALADTAAAETNAFGIAYPQMGSELIRDWGIPQKLARAVEHQLAPETAAEGDTQHLASLIADSAKVADLICELVPADALASTREKLATSVLAGLPVTPEEALKAIHEEFGSLSTTVRISETADHNTSEIQAEAGQVLGELSVAAQASNEALARQRGDLEGCWTDPITGVATRAAFDRKVGQIWADATHAGRSLALLLIDVDAFKAFNAAHGRPAGDTALRLVAAGLRQVVRPDDLIARHRADEFIVALPAVDRLTLAKLCVQLRKLIEGSGIEVAGKHHRITISIGAVLLTKSGRPFTLSELIETARRELATARGKGGNTCSMRQLQPALATA